ncbi:MAG: hypothetical protein JWQ19_1976 [Subtercola sp.]|nr:hypothetical protein [Subtercola sp.]
MASPFDDPDVQRLMSDAGVVHRPGLAAELMQELAPLLAEDGFDMDNLETADLDTLNAALARAVDRRNFERFVPVGSARHAALAMLRLTSEAIGEANIEFARLVIGGIEPEPEGDDPSVAHVIGVSLGLLDTWHTDPSLRAALRRTQVPAWEKQFRSAAVDILALASKGRAFDSIGGLHRRHSGLALLHGGILAVAGSLQAWAAHDRTTVRSLGRTALTDSAEPELARPVGNDARDLSDTAKSTFVRPLQWMLDQVSHGGIRLTAAGYLPPAIVRAAMTELGWRKDWFGKGNREDLTIPVLDLRENMMAMKLLHRRKGMLLPTPLGRSLSGDAAGLYNHLATWMLTRPTEGEAQATECFLLAVASRAFDTHSEYPAAVAKLLSSLGWADVSGRRLEPDEAFELYADTWRLMGRLGCFDDDGPYRSWGIANDIGVALARYALARR